MKNQILLIVGCGVLALLLAGCTSTPETGTWDGSGWNNALVNCHTHTDHSIDGQWSLDEAMTWHQDQGFDAVYITDHLSAYNPLPWICKTPAMDRWNDQHQTCLALPGVEWTTLNVHLLMLNVVMWDEFVPAVPNDAQVERAIEHCHDLGGICIMAHPSSPPTPGDGYPLDWVDQADIDAMDPYTWGEIEAMGADGVEGWNGGFETYYVPEMTNATLITSGTDAHAPWNENYASYFTMVHTRLTIRTESSDDIMNAIAAGNCEIEPLDGMT